MTDELNRLADVLLAKKAARHPLIKFAQEIHNQCLLTDEDHSPLEYEAVGELSDYDVVVILKEFYELKGKK
jgi:hypothetical protein